MRLSLFAASLAVVVLGGDPPSFTPRQQVIPVFMRSQWQSGWFRASGAWKQQQSPQRQTTLEAVDINCYRNLKICVEATARLDATTLGARTELYDVELWDEKQIRTARAAEPCGYFVMTIDRDPPRLYANKVNDQTRNQLCTTPGLIETIELACVAPVSVH